MAGSLPLRPVKRLKSKRIEHLCAKGKEVSNLETIFERIMLQSGVQRQSDKVRLAVPATVHAPTIVFMGDPPLSVNAAPAKADSSATAWTTGAQARKTLDTALEMLKDNRQSGWITMVRTDGTSWRYSTRATAAELLTRADHDKLRLIIIGGNGWTAIMHPQMGIATIEQDPI